MPDEFVPDMELYYKGVELRRLEKSVQQQYLEISRLRKDKSIPGVLKVNLIDSTIAEASYSEDDKLQAEGLRLMKTVAEIAAKLGGLTPVQINNLEQKALRYSQDLAKLLEQGGRKPEDTEFLKSPKIKKLFTRGNPL